MSIHPDASTEEDITWLADLFESGRGGFSMRKQTQGGRDYRHPTIRLISTDQALVDRVAAVWGTTCRPVARELYGYPRPRWQSMVVGANAAAWMTRIRPRLTGEQATKLDLVLAAAGKEPVSA